MPFYTWRCRKCEDEVELELTFSEYDDIETVNCLTCEEVMARKPGLFLWGRSPWDVLSDKMDRNYRKARAKREAREKRKRFGTHQKKVTRTDG